jgi:hypothetical protein
MNLIANKNEKIKSITHAEVVAGYDTGKWDARGRMKNGSSIAVEAAMIDGVITTEIEGLRYDVSIAVDGQVDVYDHDGMRGYIRDGIYRPLD